LSLNTSSIEGKATGVVVLNAADNEEIVDNEEEDDQQPVESEGEAYADIPQYE